MGKGGEQSESVKDVKTMPSDEVMKRIPKKALGLTKMPTEELKKWAKAYGLKEIEDRDNLIVELVSERRWCSYCRKLLIRMAFLRSRVTMIPPLNHFCTQHFNTFDINARFILTYLHFSRSRSLQEY